MGHLREKLCKLVRVAAADPKFEAAEIFATNLVVAARCLDDILRDLSLISTLCVTRSKKRLFLCSRTGINLPYRPRHFKLSPKTIKIRNLLLQGRKQKQIAKTFHCTRQYVSFVRVKYLVRFPDKR